MTWSTNVIVYPEGDYIEIDRALSLNELVDINGNPLQLPLTTSRTIAYRVYRKSTSETNNGPVIRFYLEQLSITETEQLCR